MAGKIEEVRSKLDKIAADRRDFHFEENKREEETNAGRETRSYVWREDVIGRDDDKREILKLLLETNTHGEKLSVIPIVGMGGLGKTTLAQLVFNDESVQRHFDPKIWVCVSDIFDERLIIEKMLKIAFNMNTKDLELEQLQNNLQEQLAGKRYLLVLDDVWNENPEKWKHLRGLLMSFSEGSRIIVTTRSKKVAGVMKTCIKPYDLEILDLDNSWSLFRKLAFKNGQEQINPTIEEVGKKIVRKCGGVPLAICMIGSMLYTKNLETWQLFLHKELSNMSQKENDILPTLKLSYDCLPSHLKHCFAYCRLFPKDYEIDVQTLVTLWMAQGFIQHPSQSLEEMEEIGYEYFMELLSRSFFQEDERDELDKVRECKMHDLVHDLAIQVTGGEYAMLKLGERSIDKRVRHVSFEFSLSSVDQIPSSLLQAKRLRSILLPNQKLQRRNYLEREQGESICDLIVSNFKFLRMLDLHWLGIEKLPNSIGKLKHLRYLDLSLNTEMEALPTCITELVNLQTLKLNRCVKLKELLRDINKLVNLQRLELIHCNRLKELPRDINKLVNLRHLEFYNLEDGMGISQMPRGLGQLTNLQTLSYFVLSSQGTNLESRGSELDELAGLNNLSGWLDIRGLRGGLETKGANLKEKQNLRSLSLSWGDWYGGYENDSNVDIDEKHEMTIEGLHPHPNLRELTLRYYEGVTLSSWLPLLTNLVNLQLIRCGKCRHLPPLSHLPSLKKMRLYDLPCLEYITNDDADVGGTNFWTSLQELLMNDLFELKGWWRLPDDVAENQLKLPSFPPCFSKLSIRNCQKLSCMPLYPSVEDLTLWNSGWKTFEETALKAEEEALSSLRNLQFRCLPNLVTLPEGLQRATTLQSLKSLVIWDCDDFTAIPDWICNLSSLEKLDLWECPNLKSLPASISSLTSLQTLRIYDCPTLSERCKRPTGEDWHKIQHIPNFYYR